MPSQQMTMGGMPVVGAAADEVSCNPMFFIGTQWSSWVALTLYVSKKMLGFAILFRQNRVYGASDKYMKDQQTDVL